MAPSSFCLSLLWSHNLRAYVFLSSICRMTSRSCNRHSDFWAPNRLLPVHLPLPTAHCEALTSTLGFELHQLHNSATMTHLGILMPAMVPKSPCLIAWTVRRCGAVTVLPNRITETDSKRNHVSDQLFWTSMPTQFININISNFQSARLGMDLGPSPILRRSLQQDMM